MYNISDTETAAQYRKIRDSRRPKAQALARGLARGQGLGLNQKTPQQQSPRHGIILALVTGVLTLGAALGAAYLGLLPHSSNNLCTGAANAYEDAEGKTTIDERLDALKGVVKGFEGCGFPQMALPEIDRIEKELASSPKSVPAGDVLDSELAGIAGPTPYAPTLLTEAPTGANDQVIFKVQNKSIVTVDEGKGGGLVIFVTPDKATGAD